MDLERFVLFI